MDAQHGVPLRLGHVEHHAVSQDAGGVAQDIHTAILLYGGADYRPGGVEVRHRIEAGNGVAARSANLRGHVLGRAGGTTLRRRPSRPGR